MLVDHSLYSPCAVDDASASTSCPVPCALRVTVLGCGDAFGSGGRFNSATLIDTHASRLLLDCGATTMTALNKAGIDPNSIDFVVLTHLHGDHFGGLPFLLLDAQWVRERSRPLTIIGPPGTGERMIFALEALFERSSETPWSFPWTVREIEPGASITMQDCDITTAPVVHGRGLIATAVRLTAGGCTFVHSGDSEWTDILPRIAAGADLVFIECFSATPVATHLDYQTLSARRSLFDAPRIVLTHMGPAMLAHRHEVDRTLFDLADDGMVIELRPRGS